MTRPTGSGYLGLRAAKKTLNRGLLSHIGFLASESLTYSTVAAIPSDPGFRRFEVVYGCFLMINFYHLDIMLF